MRYFGLQTIGSDLLPKLMIFLNTIAALEYLISQGFALIVLLKNRNTFRLQPDVNPGEHYPELRSQRFGLRVASARVVKAPRLERECRHVISNHFGGHVVCNYLSALIRKRCQDENTRATAKLQDGR